MPISNCGYTVRFVAGVESDRLSFQRKPSDPLASPYLTSNTFKNVCLFLVCVCVCVKLGPLREKILTSVFTKRFAESFAKLACLKLIQSVPQHLLASSRAHHSGLGSWVTLQSDPLSRGEPGTVQSFPTALHKNCLGNLMEMRIPGPQAQEF